MGWHSCDEEDKGRRRRGREREGGRGYCTRPRDTVNLIDINKFILKLTCNFCKLLSHSII